MPTNRDPDRTTVVSLLWMIAAGIVCLLALIALVLRTGLDALGKKPVFVLGLAGALLLIILLKIWTRKD
jgi:hypothetical protein